MKSRGQTWSNKQLLIPVEGAFSHTPPARCLFVPCAHGRDCNALMYVFVARSKSLMHYNLYGEQVDSSVT